MPHTTSVANPFLLMLNPEFVLAAIERSERLGQLNRHLCRPLDKVVVPAGKAGEVDARADDGEDSDTDDEPASPAA